MPPPAFVFQVWREFGRDLGQVFASVDCGRHHQIAIMEEEKEQKINFSLDQHWCGLHPTRRAGKRFKEIFKVGVSFIQGKKGCALPAGCACDMAARVWPRLLGVVSGFSSQGFVLIETSNPHAQGWCGECVVLLCGWVIGCCSSRVVFFRVISNGMR